MSWLGLIPNPCSSKCKPIKLGGSVVAVQGKTDVTGGEHDKHNKGTKKYLPVDGWEALSANANPKPVESQKEGSLEKSDKSFPSAKMKNTTMFWYCAS